MLSRLPWGVIGVAAVIIIIAAGAWYLLRDGNALTALEPEATAVIQITLSAAPPSSAESADQATSVPSPAASPDTPPALAADTPTSTPTPQVLPTDTAAPPPTEPPPAPATAAPTEYEVKGGDTCGGIARQFGVAVDDLVRVNKLGGNCLIRVGDKLIIPVPTQTPGPTQTLQPGATAPPTETPQVTATLPPQIIYQVRAGDTCGEIATRFRMPLDTLVQQNNLDANCLIQIGQVLTLTFATPAPTVSPTPIIAQTPTPRVGYNPPALVSPVDNAQITETQATVTLEWLSAGLLNDGEWYVVQVQPSGAITVPVFETQSTSLKLTRDVLGQEYERSFTWWVQVKRYLGKDPQTGARVYQDLSQPSAIRRFVWRRPPASPTPPSPSGRAVPARYPQA